MSAIDELLKLLKASDQIAADVVKAIEPVLTSSAFDDALTDAIKNADIPDIDNAIKEMQETAIKADGLTRQSREFLTGDAFKITLTRQIHETKFTDEMLVKINSGDSVTHADIALIAEKYNNIPPSMFLKAVEEVAEREASIRGLAAELISRNGLESDVAHDAARSVWVQQKTAEAAIDSTSKNADNANVPPVSATNDVDSAAPVDSGNKDPNAFPRDDAGNPSKSTADAADDLGSNPPGYTVPRNKSRMATAAKWTWDHTAGVVLNPIGRFLSDSYELTTAMPNYLKRAWSWKFADQQQVNGLFARMDTFKTTNTSRLSVLINPNKNQLVKETGEVSTYVYKAADTNKAANDLTGSMHNVEATLTSTSSSVAEEVDVMAKILETASLDILNAAEKIKLAKATNAQIVDLRFVADEFKSAAQSFVSGTVKDAPLGIMERTIALKLNNTTDPDLLSALTSAQKSVADLIANGSKIDDAEIAANAAQIYGELSLRFSTKADESAAAVANMTGAANDTIRAHMATISSAGERSDAIFDDLKAAADQLSDDVNIINRSLDDMAAAPPEKIKDRLVGGTVVARLAAYDAAPHMAQITGFSDNVTSLSNDIKSSLDISEVKGMLDNTLQASEGNKIDKLVQLSEELAKKADDLRNGSVKEIDGVLSSYGNANKALTDMDNIVVTYTHESISLKGGLFSVNDGGGKANTNLMTGQNVGRIEREVSSDDVKRFKALLNSGDIRIETNMTQQQLINHRPGEDLYNINASNANSGVIHRSDEEKFFQFSMVGQGAKYGGKDEAGNMIVALDKDAALKKAMTTSENILSSGDENRYWEAMKWSMLSYARDPKTGSSVGQNRNTMFDELLEKMRLRGQGLGDTGAREGPYSDRILDATSNAIASLDAIGANSFRSAWVNVWERTRNVRFPQDFANEKISTDPFERGTAQKWSTTFGPKGSMATTASPITSPLLRMSTVVPKAIWDNFPYRQTHFGSKAETALTLTKLAGTAGTLWFLGSAAKKYVFGESDKNAPAEADDNGITLRETPVRLANNIDDAKDLSEDNVELVVEKIDEINERYEDMFKNVQTVFDDQIAKIDSLIRVETSMPSEDSADKISDYNKLRSQVEDTFKAYAIQLETDQAQIGTGAELSRLGVQKLDNLIQEEDPPLQVDVANSLLRQQNDFINTLGRNSDLALKNGMVDTNAMIVAFDEAIKLGKPLDALPTPSMLNTKTPDEIAAQQAIKDKAEADAKAAEALRIAEIARIAAEEKLNTARDVNTAAQDALKANPDDPALQAAAVKAQTEYDALNTVEIARLKAVEDARIAAAAKAQADADAKEAARIAALSPEQKGAKDALADATRDSGRIAKLYGTDEAKNSAAFLVAGMKTQQVDKVIALSEELYDKGDHTAVGRINELLADMNGNNRAAEEHLEQLGQNKDRASALQKEITDLNTQIQGMTALTGKDSAIALLATLQSKTDAVEIIKTESQSLHTQIKTLVSDNTALLQENPDTKHHFGTGGTFQRGAIAAGGGEYGLLNQFLGSENGGDSVVGGYFNMAASKLRDGKDWWSEVKRGAKTQGEMNGYNLAEQGFLAFMSIVALNKVGEWTGMSKGVKIAALVGIIGYFIHRSGATGQDMRDHSDAKNSFAQVNPSLRGRNNIPTAVAAAFDGSSTKNVKDNVVTLTGKDGQPINHELKDAGQKGITAQSKEGEVPSNVVDLDAARVTKEQADKALAAGQGNARNIPGFVNKADEIKIVPNGETDAPEDNVIPLPNNDNIEPDVSIKATAQ